ncbi:hypothetical protein [Bacillus sp. ISL-45]|uniref:hypothetical protein n=1 Tax=Bacillus sp. ISL-45 TaxID=2819128 RepID=UPI001BED15CD|nr:hypothetical protein [Bacillus sp. ISL-45]MBT2661583.1 hypothetical protein [Bacillus sp. ISL-45]
MTYRVWAIRLVVTLVLLVAGIGGFNYWMDPMWMYGGAHEFNDVQDTINERQQKTNRIKFQPFSVDTLLIGSSRSTYIDQHEFEGMDVYNYSVANMSVKEYESYIAFAKENSKKEIKTVIIGLDFFKSSLAESKAPLSIYPYAKTLDEPFVRWKNIISYDLTRYSFYNFKASIKDEPVFVRTYDRQNVASTIRLSKEDADEELQKKVEKFTTTFYGDYEYNPNYKKILQNIKDKNPDTKFIVFTTPISEPLFQALIDSGAYPHYERWLSEVTAVFGSVYNFMDINTVTKDTSNYFDGHHFYPEVGTMIARRISMDNPPDVPSDFGKIVTGTSQ